MGLLDSLGLDDVNADPNALPDGKYGATIFKSDVIVTKKGDVAWMIVYKVNDNGSQNGKEKAEFFNLGNNPVKDEKGKVVGMTPTMTDQQKPYFKRRLLSVGIPESRHNDFDGDMALALVGTDIIFGIRNNNGYSNVNFVELRNEGQSAPHASEGVNPFEASGLPTNAPAPTPTGGGNLSDML